MEPLSEQVRPLGLRNGRSGFGVTTLGFGAAPIANIRGNVSDEEALAAVKDAKDCGCGFFDTAPWYGRGLSERRLGVALSNYERSSYRLQTKVGRFIVAGQPNDRDASGGEINAGSYQGAHGAAFGVVHDYRHDSVLRQHQDSLQRLGVSRIDSLVIHDLDYGHGSAEQIEGYLTELEGGARALADLRTAGTISAFGCGCNNFSQGW
jgi:D-threo-aldose 1-dehydrogenase